jgi:hypothetical protein
MCEKSLSGILTGPNMHDVCIQSQSAAPSALEGVSGQL